MSLVRINKNPSDRQLTVFCAAWFVVFGVFGWRLRAKGYDALFISFWILAVGVPLIGLFSRRFVRIVYLGLSYATYPVGFAVSRALLTVSYYLVLTPIGLTMRLFRYDPLARSFDPEAQSYWIRRNGSKPAETYFDQS
ncbi:MAG TPA: SxtJ family membrane protein [Opitutaceae bacterium]|jgi:hypothetical protein